ncbi:MAG: hypothetical protein D6765_13770, partial [Bacteroidetes bacterium]
MPAPGNLLRSGAFWGLLFGAQFALGQGHQPVFPGLTGDALLDSLRAHYSPTTILNNADARDTLFARIYNHDDSLTCVYTGFTIWLDPTQDPTQAAFMNGGPDAINTEHTYPQSFGATGLARSDMHHLFPTRLSANDARANDPFAEIPDESTERWFYLDQVLTTPPATHRERYSEDRPDAFEPREDHKGNVARAMFYFYTIYREQADAANAAFFESQRPTLCQWHFLDPVDALEWERTFKIAAYQGNPNPFVLDCTLPERSYCAEFAPRCSPASTAGEAPQT